MHSHFYTTPIRQSPNSCRALQCLLFIFLFLSFYAFPIHAQSRILNKYWIEFTDKNHTPYSIWRPGEFLSARALERRAQAGIAVVENDLPVDPAYIKGLLATGATLHNTSRWLNAATIVADTAVVARIRRLPFVQRIEYIGRDIRFRNPRNRPAKGRTPLAQYPKAQEQLGIWGYNLKNIYLPKMHVLNALEARGKGMWIAVMDGGFTNVDTLPFFDSIALQRRLWPGPDFVERDHSVYESAQHGTSVLSVMASNLPYYFMGNAPDATYFLLKTEDVGGEYPVEEANWIAGAEWADSIGVDVINASLGYTLFSDTTLGHRYRELDGRSSIGTRGATIAATKGMIICNSAGNEGDGTWRYIGVPADARGVVTVGATQTTTPLRASFSSIGPTADGRIKPDLVVPGDEIVGAGGRGTQLGVSSGTSMASPLLVGALASLWSAFPEKTAASILDAVFRSADQYRNPDNMRGYGMPNFLQAWLSLGQLPLYSRAGSITHTEYGTNRVRTLPINFSLDKDPCTFVLYNAYGQQVASGPVQVKGTASFQYVDADLPDRLPKGAYTLGLMDRMIGKRIPIIIP